MKRILIIVLSFLFLLPSIGIHVDMSHCCGSIENLGISHSANIEVGTCCHIEKSSECDTDKEIIQAPSYLDLALGTKYSLKNIPSFTLPFCSISPIVQFHWQATNTPTVLTSINRHSPSFLQVFLC